MTSFVLVCSVPEPTSHSEFLSLLFSIQSLWHKKFLRSFFLFVKKKDGVLVKGNSGRATNRAVRWYGYFQRSEHERIYSPGFMKLQGFHITRDHTSLFMSHPCSFRGDMSVRSPGHDATTGMKNKQEFDFGHDRNLFLLILHSCSCTEYLRLFTHSAASSTFISIRSLMPSKWSAMSCWANSTLRASTAARIL
ncbi:hypothetical protein U27_04551 [Candidatus Vecturithrix granuli]|uniref:Uncharacterized protein n=1 Tax=Vecturithrix granuli TaxID=1499967 RepID=A0A081BZ29_VECG1|nr:hypothetical protein U27_04551 [Candidatus Vecturithrix granuli]